MCPSLRPLTVSLLVSGLALAPVGLPQAIADSDGDGIPDAVERALGLDIALKDNDVFGNAQLFVMQQYRDFLSREGDSSGIAFWQSELQSGRLTRAALVERYLGTPEFQSGMGALTRLYIAVFRRLPDAAGLSYWTRVYNTGGGRLDDIATQFTQTPEFAGLYGALDDDAFVDQIYQNVLGRAPDAAGATFWRTQLSAGITRGALLVSFTESAEYAARTASTVYLVAVYYALLRRAPDQAGYDTWHAYLASGRSGQDLITQFLAAEEYRARFLPSFPGVTAALTLNLSAPENYANPPLPRHYDATVLARDNTPADNPVTDRGATLGRVLFHDKRLSINDAVSCASCHQQSLGFSDGNRFSAGFAGTQFTTAHAMRLTNLRYYEGRTMFWDKRSASAEAQATQPVQNNVEMGFDAAHGGIPALVNKLSNLPYYRELFTWTFGDAAITEERIQKSIAQFERAMVSTASRFDTAYAQVYNPSQPQRGLLNPFPGFSAQEERGKQLFVQGVGAGGAGCAACHVPPTFALAGNARSNGLDAGETVVFKSPSLKHVASGGPYMHDGRFSTLEQVVDHYSTGIRLGPALDNRLRNGPNPRNLNLSTADRDALVAFMKTLDDPVLAADSKFSNPFRQ